MVELPQAPRKTNANFGTFAVPDKDNFAQELEPKQRLEILGWLQACPNPKAIAEEYGQEWTTNRYLNCNYWGAYIIDRAKTLNPPLARQLLTPISRPADEKPVGYNPESVPDSYTTTVSPGTTPWGYAAARVLIEETGRDWKIGELRVKRAQILLEDTLKSTSSPAEFLAILASETTKADADPTKVLGHIFAVELEQEGVLFLVEKVVREIKRKTPWLWSHYLSLTPEQKQAAGIIPSLS